MQLEINFEPEIWKDAVGYEGLYEVSTYGNVRSAKFGKRRKFFKKVLKPRTTCNGYDQVQLTINKKSKNVSVHRLVAIAFIPNPENKPCVNHLDCNRANNNVKNLEWATYSENQLYAYRVHGKTRFYKGTDKVINKKPVVRIDGFGNIKEYDSGTDAQNVDGFNKRLVCACCRGLIGSHRNYKWVFKKDFVKNNLQSLN